MKYILYFVLTVAFVLMGLYALAAFLFLCIGSFFERRNG